MTNVILKASLTFLTLICLVIISGCSDDDSPQNSDIHFTNSTDKNITIKYYQEVSNWTNDGVSTVSKSDLIPIGEKRTLTIQESLWRVSFTIVYDGVEYDETISVNFVGGDEDYNVTKESLGIAPNG
jgi:hypothetical protein